MSQRLFLLVGVGCLLFVLYGSLVPLNFHALPLDVAWKRFLDAPYLEVNIRHREDLIANMLLYVPIGLCFTAALGGATGRYRVPAGIAAFFLCVVAGTTIEFVQVFFPGRTVSLNDLFANAIGAAGGVSLWWFAGTRLDELASRVRLGGPGALRAAVTLYILAYLALSLFPYDLILNSDELRWKIDSGRWGVLLAPAGCDGFFACGIKLAAEVAAMVPLGLLMGMILTRRAHGAHGKALMTGLGLGILIEAGQFFIVTGYSQGISILTRPAGMVLGIACHRFMDAARLEAARHYLRHLAALAAAPYLILLVALNGWFAARWVDAGTAFAGLREISFLPFYYHYYTTESTALHSLLRIATVYAPIGVGCWMWRAGAGRGQPSSPWMPALLGAIVALVVETGKLFVPGKKPDPTDVLIAGCAAAIAYLVAVAVWRSLTRETPSAARGAGPPAAAGPVAGAPLRAGERLRSERVPAAQGTTVSTPFAVRAIALPLLIAGAAFLLRYPYGGALACFLALYGALIWRWPKAALPAVLALLPVLDVTPWSGWFFFNEFDAVLLVTVAVLLWRIPAGHWSLRAAGVPGWLAWTLAASYAVSALIGLFPLQPLDANAFSNYLSHYSSLRTLKGFLWAFVLAAPVIHQLKEGIAGERAIVTGVLLGLAGVALVAVWERQIFTGLFNFSSDYRIAATFSSLHTGGALVEAYLVLTIPFLAAWFHLRASALARLAAVGLFVLASYALIVTFSRAGYAGYAVGLAIVALGALLRAVTNRKLATRLLAATALFVAVCAVVAVPLSGGGFMLGRWAKTGSDMDVRTAHWTDVLSMVDSAPGKRVFGMGLGRFPETYYLHHSGQSGSYRYAREAGNAYLVLGAGQSLWFEQRLPVAADAAYTLALDVRSAAESPDLGIALCEKSILYSRNCQSFDVRPGATNNQWRKQQVTVMSAETGRGAWYNRRPVHLALTNRGAGTLVEVDNIRLLDSNGRDLVRNGDFSRGHDHWFFSADFHQPWHTHSVPLQVWFEQGGFGLLAFSVAVGYTLVRLARGIAGGDTLSAVLMAGITGFLIVGLFDSLFDAPRLTLLFFLLLFVAAAAPFAAAQRQPAGRDPRAEPRTSPNFARNVL